MSNRIEDQELVTENDDSILTMLFQAKILEGYRVVENSAQFYVYPPHLYMWLPGRSPETLAEEAAAESAVTESEEVLNVPKQEVKIEIDAEVVKAKIIEADVKADVPPKVKTKPKSKAKGKKGDAK